MSAPVSFFDVVSARQETLNTLLCVGLDPDVSKIPQRYQGCRAPGCSILSRCDRCDPRFSRDLQASVRSFCGGGCVGRSEGDYRLLPRTEVPVILDAKRGDVAAPLISMRESL